MNNDLAVNQENNGLVKKICKNWTFTFTYIFLINIGVYFGTLIKFNLYDFSICQWPIIYKYQYYRMITHNFFHLGIIHIAFNMIFFYYVCKKMEKKIGTAFMLIFIFESVYFISTIYLFQITILKYIIITLFKFTEYNFDFYCSVGFSGVLFSLYYLECNFKKVAETSTQFFGLIPIKAKYSPFIYLLLIQVLSPNSSLLGHLSGILTGYLLKNIFVYFIFPRKEWIESFENKFETLFYCMSNKLKYIQVSCIPQVYQEEELKEIDKRLSDLCIVKYIKNLITKREAALNSNIPEDSRDNNIINVMRGSDLV